MAASIPSEDMLLKKAIDLFKAEFESVPDVAACAPGRVNLMGEHTDYNGGLVLPMALPHLTIMAGKRNNSKEICLCTSAHDVDIPQKVKFSLEDKIVVDKPQWVNYVKGVVAEFQEAEVPGFDAVIVSSVPVGGGISSSAALEVSSYTFLEALTGKATSNLTTKALACQRAETVYAGVPCGIMDQLVSVSGRENQALLIDCRSLEVNYIPFEETSNVVVLITNSNVKHELSSSEYSIRKKQCAEVANALKKISLRDVKESDLLELEKAGIDATLVARGRHVVGEIKRTEEAAKALLEKDFISFGKLMVASHDSLRDNYEVSCKELDELVEAATELDEVYGSRMTGGGFGGCTVTLVKAEAVNKCIQYIKNRYSRDPTFYVCKPSGGCRQLII